MIHPRHVYATIAGDPDDPDNRSGGNRGKFTPEERAILYGPPERCEQVGHSYTRLDWGTCLRCGYRKVPGRYYNSPSKGRKGRLPFPAKKRPGPKPKTPQYPGAV